MKRRDTLTPLATRWPLASATALLLAVCLAGSGCKKTPAPIVANNPAAADNGDPADGNLAPVEGTGSGQPAQVLGSSSAYAPQQQAENYAQQPAAPVERQQPGAAQDDQNYAYNAPADGNEGSGQTVYADQPPPPLPDYEQPPAPDPDDLWTPGYWDYASAGYYWVPGVWTAPPYYGALWTPPYWGFYNGRYAFHHGYWGPHIGFYGGIDYGHGYIGTGYYGGYWQNNHFYYNRAVNNINTANIHNVYDRSVVMNNVHYSGNIVNRVSYNGGGGGIHVAPRPAELAALHEEHSPALAAQVQVRQQAVQNRQQFFNQNHGRPAEAVIAHPIGSAHIAAPPPAAAAQMQRANEIRNNHQNPVQPRSNFQQPTAGQEQRNQQLPEQNQQRSLQEQQRNAQEQQRNAEQQQRNQQEQQRNQQEQQRGAQPAPAERPQAAPQHQNPPAARPQEQARPQPAPAERPHAAPQHQNPPAARPQEQSRPQPAARPAPETRPAAVPHAEAPHEAPHPAAHEAPHPAAHEEEHPR